MSYVNNGGNDAGAGTIGDPFATLAHAISVAVSTEEIYCYGGHIFTTSQLNISIPLTVSSYGTGKATVRNQSGDMTAGFIDQGGGIYYWPDSISTVINLFQETDVDGNNPILIEHVSSYANLTNEGQVFWDSQNAQAHPSGSGVYWIPTGGNIANKKLWRNNSGLIFSVEDTNDVLIDSLIMDQGVGALTVTARNVDMDNIAMNNCDVSNMFRNNYYSSTANGTVCTNFKTTNNTFDMMVNGAVHHDSNGQHDSGVGIGASSFARHLYCKSNYNTITNINPNDTATNFRAAKVAPSVVAPPDIEGIDHQYAKYAEVIGNNIDGVTINPDGVGTGIIFWNDTGVVGSGSSNTIRGNFIKNVGGSGIILGGGKTHTDVSKDHRVDHNIIIGTGGTYSIGLNINGQDSGNNTLIHHNSVYGCNINIDTSDNGGGLVVDQNISIEPVTYHVRHGLNEPFPGTLDSNHYYHTSGNAGKFRRATTDYDTAAAAFGETNERGTDPLITTSPPTVAADFTLQSGSPAINITANTSYGGFDYYDNPEQGLPDAGAIYDYSPARGNLIVTGSR